ncbi:hypothetical protein [Actinomadura flavalba]|uniref:hypothetical protein n=1 Tax=Actinomadura flavalba TaxID=1120938 RepID=UPI0003643CCB|nr:hypothetical protein [Actinomadura flavalba]
MIITAEHVQRLLDAEGEEAALVLIGGRAEVVADAADSGGLLVTDRQDLLRRVEAEGRTPATLERIAAGLDTAVADLGG